MADTETKYDVFISYSHKDEEWVVEALLPGLETAGLKVCIDYRDFAPGKPSRHNMRDACMASAHTLLVMTPAWMASEWTSFENLLSFLHDPAGKRQRTIPILLEKCDIPEDIQIFTYVDFTRTDRLAIAWRQLFTALGRPDAPVPGTPVKEPEPERPKGWFLAHPYPMPPNFTGRRVERDMLTGWLDEDNDHPLLILRALGGFGKSALAWYWLTHDVDPKQYPAVVFWSFYEGDASFENFLKMTLTYLCIPDADRMNPRQQTEVLLNILQRPGLLLILDGFERDLRAYGSLGAAYQGDELQKEKEGKEDTSRDCIDPYADAFLRGLGAFGFLMRSKVLMTTRLTPCAVESHGQFLQGVREEQLRAMSKPDAVAFFHAQGIRGTHTEIEAACEPYGCHPLSLRILAGLVANDRRAPGDIAVARNLEISDDIIQNKHHILAAAFDTLSASQRKLLGRIACFRAPVEYEALKAIHAAGQGSEFLDGSLKMLESRGLLHWDRQTNKYDLHPIVRRYAYERLTAPDRAAAHARLVDYFAAVPELEKVEKLEDLAPVIELYHHMLRAGKLDDARDLFRDRLHSPLYYQLGAYRLIIELLKALFIDGEEKPPRLQEESDQAWTLNALANSYSLSGQPRRAVPLFKMQIALREKMREKNNLAIGLGNVAFMAQLPTGALEQAEHSLRRSLDLSREIADEESEGTGQYELGRVLAYAGQWDESEKALDNGEIVKKKTNHIQAQGVIWSYRALRFLLLARGDAPRSASSYHQSAIGSAARALELADEDARTSYPVERDYVRAHWLLGAAYRLSGDLPQAETHLGEALQRCRAINMVDHEADILLEIAKLRHAQGNPAESLRLAQEARLITERSGYVLQGADVHLWLAELALAGLKADDEKALSDQAAALVHAREALRLAHCDDGPPYHYKVAYDEAERLIEKLN